MSTGVAAEEGVNANPVYQGLWGMPASSSVASKRSCAALRRSSLVIGSASLPFV